MVYNNSLTAAQKDKKIPIIINRDGNVCFFCKTPFVPELDDLTRVIDHANNDSQDNRVENLLLAHRKCNESKKTNPDYQILATNALKENLTRVESLSERKKDNDTDELTEGDINLIINKLVRAELETKLPEGSTADIQYGRTLKNLHFLLIEETHGRGSEPAVRRALDAYCSDFAPWMSQKRGRGNRVILRRKTG